MATVRVSPTEVQVDETIYAFTDADMADGFESCIATTGDVSHCIKEQTVTSSKKADSSERLPAIG